MNDRTANKWFLWFGLAIPYLMLTGWSMRSFLGAKIDCHSSHQAFAQALTPPPVPDFQQIAALATGGLAAMPTQEQQQEQHEIEQQQIELARQWLTESDEALRIRGAEQLSAYPVRESALALVKALKQDTSSAVRAAAASLSYFEPSKPHAFIINELFSALSDRDQEVASNAFSSLQALITHPDLEAKTAKQTLSKLKQLAKKPRLNEVTRQMLEDFLQDQASL